MLKRLTAWQARPGIAVDDAVRHWLTGHVPLVRAVPGVARYVQSSCVTGPSGERPPYAGLGELWFETAADARTALASPAWRQVLDDAASFMDLERTVVAWAEERPT